MLNKIFILSYNKAGRTCSQNLFGDTNKVFLVCPESQAEDYRTHGWNNVFSIPDRIDGNNARKKNYIIQKCVGFNEVFWFIDDDIHKIQHLRHNHVLSGDDLLEYMENVEVMLYDYDKVAMAGFNAYANNLYYQEHKPFNFVQPVYCFVAIRNIGIRCDENLRSEIDADFCLQVLQRGFRILRDNRFHAFNEQFKGEKSGGIGLSNHDRSQQRKILQKKWGSKIVAINEDGTGRPLKIPLKGV